MKMNATMNINSKNAANKKSEHCSASEIARSDGKKDKHQQLQSKRKEKME